jgi:hypothetical protein
MSLGINAIVGALAAPPAPFVPEQHHLQPGYVILLPASVRTTSTATSSIGFASRYHRCSTW